MSIDRIRELEIKVIALAKEDHKGGCAPETCGGSSLDPCQLHNAIQSLTYECEECNAGGHTCPGDGQPIPHGASNCGQHDEPKLIDSHWVPSTFLHIEEGDRLRIGEDEATVLAVSKLGFHADNTRPRDPKPWEHVELRADLGFGMTSFPTNTAVEILCSVARRALLNLSEAGFQPKWMKDSDHDV